MRGLCRVAELPRLFVVEGCRVPREVLWRPFLFWGGGLQGRKIFRPCARPAVVVHCSGGTGLEKPDPPGDVPVLGLVPGVNECLTTRTERRTFCPMEDTMTILNATEARARLYALIDEASQTHRPIVITGKRNNAVLIAEDDWNAINETLYLLSVPGMRESIRAGLDQNLSECSTELDW